ncbi:hypothetical protein ACFVIM_31565 [Streptomyces sp. NPDC057638]|uniref:hypothetical protein n=1 Tax=Streptomyces sp. NPDC057638 TaxID=3346190 RepID=UPI0036A28948
MNDGALPQLRTQASRDDYASMARLARALHETGLSTREVLRECYAVDLPQEFFALAEDGPWRLGLMITNQPWRLTVPLERGGPNPEPTSRNSIERRLLALDPDLLPLLHLRLSDEAPIEMLPVICYRFSELRERRTTVFVVPGVADHPDEIGRTGDSLLDVLHAFQIADVRGLEEEFEHPANWGIGEVQQTHLDGAREMLARIDRLRSEVASYEGW